MRPLEPGERGELADLLVSWRSRLSPEDVGMASGSGRKVKGLRRAEVAVLADISTDYLQRLEQGRSTRPSRQVLETLSRVFQLNERERSHLFRAAGVSPAARGLVPRYLSPGTLRLMQRLGDVPVGTFDAAWTFITGNRGWDCLFGVPSQSSDAGMSLNLAWLHFTGRLTAVSLDGRAQEDFERAIVSDMRVASVAYPADPHLAALVDNLGQVSSVFAQLWAAGELVVHRSDVKAVQHPAVGTISLDCDVLHVPGNDVRLVLYSARLGSRDADKLNLALTLGRQPFALTRRRAPRPSAVHNPDHPPP